LNALIAFTFVEIAKQREVGDSPVKVRMVSYNAPEISEIKPQKAVEIPTPIAAPKPEFTPATTTSPKSAFTTPSTITTAAPAKTVTSVTATSSAPRVTSTSTAVTSRTYGHEQEDPYLTELRNLINQNLIYPAKAQRLGQEGKVTVYFKLEKDGTFRDLKIITASGFSILDTAAIDLINSIRRYKPIPERLQVSVLPIKQTLIYTTEI
jgi:protein TonB